MNLSCKVCASYSSFIISISSVFIIPSSSRSQSFWTFAKVAVSSFWLTDTRYCNDCHVVPAKTKPSMVSIATGSSKWATMTVLVMSIAKWSIPIRMSTSAASLGMTSANWRPLRWSYWSVLILTSLIYQSTLLLWSLRSVMTDNPLQTLQPESDNSFIHGW